MGFPSPLPNPSYILSKHSESFLLRVWFTTNKVHVRFTFPLGMDFSSIRPCFNGDFCCWRLWSVKVTVLIVSFPVFNSLIQVSNEFMLSFVVHHWKDEGFSQDTMCITIGVWNTMRNYHGEFKLHIIYEVI